jgi:hypothetical protein
MSETTTFTDFFCSALGLFHDGRNGSDDRLTLKSVNLKYSLVLTGTFKFKTCHLICRTVSQRYELCLEDEGTYFDQFL